MGRFYVTTPIYYVNDIPHIGHAYTTILADVLARYHRKAGDEVWFLTGTDEHGQKAEQAAKKRGLAPAVHCDEMVENFRSLWMRLGISNDDFIRTTEARHMSAVQHALSDLHAKGEIYAAPYVGWYCVPCERFCTEKDLVDGSCPDCRRAVQRLEEKNWFFRMGKYRDWLREHIETHPGFIAPETRKNEVLGFLQKPLEDLCISRPKSRLSWGIPLPFDPDYVTYVWFDALMNYATAIGYPGDPAGFDRRWPAMHLIGKDILTTHSVYWPTMLRALGLPAPKTIAAHGWWLTPSPKCPACGEKLQDAPASQCPACGGLLKISKTGGTAVKPLDLLERHGVDAFRYFLMREMSFGQDAGFSVDVFERRYEADLANAFGNLLSRVIPMIENYRSGVVPSPAEPGPGDDDLRALMGGLEAKVVSAIEAFSPNLALEAVFGLVDRANRYVQETTPWLLAKDPSKAGRLDTVLSLLAESLRHALAWIEPVIPAAAAEGWRQLGLEGSPSCASPPAVGRRVRKGAPLFPKTK